MAYSNNTSLYYPTPPVSGEFGSYQFLGQTLTTEEVNGQADSTFNQWNTIRGWPGPMAGSPTSLRVTVSYGEYYRNTFVDWCVSFRSQWFRSPHTKTGAAAMTYHHTRVPLARSW